MPIEQTWPRQIALPIYVGLCLLLGGASAAGVVANAVLQSFAVAIITYKFWVSVGAEPGDRHLKSPTGIYWLAGLFLCWVVIQLIPLPPQLWQILPGRGFIRADDAALGMIEVWRPISMQPDRVIFSALSILPPFAVYLLTMRATHAIRCATIYGILAIAILSSIIGLVQVAQGSASPAYFYDITNSNTSVGFFSNANHLATLFLIGLVLTADIPFRPVNQRHKLVWLAVRTLLMLFMLLNIFINRSLAGYVLAVPALGFWLIRTETGQRLMARVKAPLALIVTVSLLVTIAGLWHGSRFLDEMALNLVGVSERVKFLQNSMAMIADSFPIGTGLGSFRWVYAGYEDLALVTSTYVNHAHNDFAEFLVEGGLMAILLVAGLFYWCVRRLIALFGANLRQPDYVYAAPMIILLVAFHSLVDYPVRTAAIASICAFCIGIMAASPTGRTFTRHSARA